MKNSIYLSFCFVFISTFGIAQSSTDDLQALLISPANSVEYYKKLEPVSKLIEEQKWSEAESILVQLT